MGSAFRKAFKIYKYLISISILGFLIYFLIDDFSLIKNSPDPVASFFYSMIWVLIYAFEVSFWFWLVASITITIDFYTKETK